MQGDVVKWLDAEEWGDVKCSGVASRDEMVWCALT